MKKQLMPLLYKLTPIITRLKLIYKEKLVKAIKN